MAKRGSGAHAARPRCCTWVSEVCIYKHNRPCLLSRYHALWSCTMCGALRNTPTTRRTHEKVCVCVCVVYYIWLRLAKHGQGFTRATHFLIRTASGGFHPARIRGDGGWGRGTGVAALIAVDGPRQQRGCGVRCGLRVLTHMHPPTQLARAPAHTCTNIRTYARAHVHAHLSLTRSRLVVVLARSCRDLQDNRITAIARGTFAGLTELNKLYGTDPTV